jgi:hypothetical protein
MIVLNIIMMSQRLVMGSVTICLSVLGKYSKLVRFGALVVQQKGAGLLLKGSVRRKNW